MQRSKTLFGVIAASAALLITAGVTTASAAPADVPSGVPTTTTLPLLGVPLSVEVTTGPGGALGTVALTGSGDYTATTLTSGRVVFENTDGTGKVKVGSGHGGQSVSARAGSLADISGDGTWSGDVFNTGAATGVAFTIGATTDGGPDITNVTSDDATAVIAPTEYRTGDDDDESEAAAIAKVTFTAPGKTRTLAIVVRTHTDEDGTTSASARVTLGRIHATALPVGEAIGDKSYQGLLCDGSVFTVNYNVAEDGTITFLSADPDTATSKTDGNGIEVRFSQNERVRVRSQVTPEGITVKVGEKVRCEGVAPTVNTPISPTVTTTNEHSDDDHSDDHSDDHGEGHHGGKGKGDSHDTPPTVSLPGEHRQHG